MSSVHPGNSMGSPAASDRTCSKYSSLANIGAPQIVNRRLGAVQKALKGKFTAARTQTPVLTFFRAKPGPLGLLSVASSIGPK